MRRVFLWICVVVVVLSMPLASGVARSNRDVATFAIVAHDAKTGESGVAVASRFFAVGSVVPWARAGVGAVATQAYANTSFGWRGLELLEAGLTPQEVKNVLTRIDDDPTRRQFGVVDTDGRSATYTGDNCNAWAGGVANGRAGSGYAIQGNILAGEAVVVAMEKAYLATEGTLADRLYAALVAGEEAGGDSRGKQSAALLVVREGAGYGGYDDRAIDIRVDDHAEPFKELGRILKIAQMNYSWNDAWTLFSNHDYQAAVAPMERAAKLAPDYGEVHYDLACIRLAVKDKEGALEALRAALKLNPKLSVQATSDSDLDGLRGHPEFTALLEKYR